MQLGSNLPQWLVMVGGHGVLAQVASMPADIQRGLMYRTHLAPNTGMLFLLGHEADHRFFMRNTVIPLDMIFIGRNMTVVGIVHSATPLTETQRHVGRPSLYVLEVEGGWSAKNSVAIGSPVRFRTSPR